MTLAVSITLLAILMIWCGVYGHSLQHALLGRSVAGGTGSVVAAS